MVHSMLSSSKVPKSFWIDSIKTTAYILNRVPSKAVPKTPFELFKCWKPSLFKTLWINVYTIRSVGVKYVS